MFILNWFYETLTVERVKAIAALIQALGFIVAAKLAYKLGRKLEEHKFEMKLKEIMHANTHKRRLETLEKISELMGKVLFDLEEITPNLGSPKASPEWNEGEEREEYFRRFFKQRVDDYNQSLRNLFDTCESGFMYLNPELYKMLYDFRIECTLAIQSYQPRMLEKHHDSNFYHNLDKEFRAACHKMRLERGRIVDLMKVEMLLSPHSP
jgi:hypothetical protein